MSGPDRPVTVDLCFDPKLKPYLLQLKDQFTSIALQYAIQLKSLYAIRIYELLKQYQRLKQRTLGLSNPRSGLSGLRRSGIRSVPVDIDAV